MTREQLIASLTATVDHKGWCTTDLDDQRYADWSTRTDDGGRVLEVGDADGDALQLEMSRDELIEFHRALTLTLLADSEPDTR